MGTYKVNRKIYSVNKLEKLTPEQFYGLKRQIIQNPDMELAKKKDFFSENILLIICIIALPIGGILTTVHEGFTAIVVLSFLVIVFALLTGSVGEMIDFFETQKRSEKYQKAIKSLILSSNAPDEFNSELIELNKNLYKL